MSKYVSMEIMVICRRPEQEVGDATFLHPEEFFWTDILAALRKGRIQTVLEAAEVVAKLLNDGSKARAPKQDPEFAHYRGIVCNKNNVLLWSGGVKAFFPAQARRKLWEKFSQEHPVAETFTDDQMDVQKIG